jgi:hypothetical protein
LRSDLLDLPITYKHDSLATLPTGEITLKIEELEKKIDDFNKKCTDGYEK